MRVDRAIITPRTFATIRPPQGRACQGVLPRLRRMGAARPGSLPPTRVRNHFLLSEEVSASERAGPRCGWGPGSIHHRAGPERIRCFATRFHARTLRPSSAAYPARRSRAESSPNRSGVHRGSLGIRNRILRWSAVSGRGAQSRSLSPKPRDIHTGTRARSAKGGPTLCLCDRPVQPPGRWSGPPPRRTKDRRSAPSPHHPNRRLRRPAGVCPLPFHLV